MAITPKIPLRERKQVRTRLALVRAVVERLEASPLEAIPVNALCDDVEISEATFFNYFSKKSDLLDYHVQLWIVEITWHLQQQEKSGLAAIGALFDYAAHQFQQRPGLMGEVIARQAQRREKAPAIAMGRADLRLAFPTCEGIEETPIAGLDAVLVPNLQQAIKRGELPANTHLPTVMIALISLFYGIPLVLMMSNPSVIATSYRQQLIILWGGLRNASQRA